MAAANPSTTTDGRSRSSPLGRSLGALLAGHRDHPLARLLQAVAFWAAVVLPFLSLALLLGPGVGTAGGQATLFALLAGNVVAVVGGHGYEA